MICRYHTRFRHRLPVVLAAALLLGAGQVDPQWLAQWTEAERCKPDVLTSTERIAPKDEPGTPFIIEGRVLLRDSRTPARHIDVHAMHRDAEGFEFGPGDRDTRTWRLQGWATTDEAGRFTFKTIRPAADHLGREAAHVHFTLVSEQFGRQWAPKIFLAEDPLVTPRQRQRSLDAGAFASVVATERVDGVDVLRVVLPLESAADF